MMTIKPFYLLFELEEGNRKKLATLLHYVFVPRIKEVIMKKKKDNTRLYLNKVSIVNLEKIRVIKPNGLSPTIKKGVWAAGGFNTVKTIFDRTCDSYNFECDLADG